MSKLDKLIEKLCPNGVEYKKIFEVCNGHYGNGNNIPTDGGIYPVYGCNGIVGNTSNFNSEDAPIVGHIGSAGIVIWGEGKHYVTYNGTICTPKLELINSKFLYYNLVSLHLERYVKGTQPFLSFSDFENIKIPVPPLEIQREIVSILDNLTELSKNLSEELKARQKQYEYYRDNLFNFDNKIPRKTLSELCKLSAGGDIDKSKIRKDKNDEYNIPIYSNGIGNNALYGYTNSYKIEAPALTISGRGTIGYCELRRENFYPIVRLICLKPKEDLINIEFLKYYIDTITFKVPKTGIPQLTVPMISNYLIPVPPIEEQERIVKILDKFDKLCNDISEGLPAEIETRQKQYDYYRDKLLTFEKQ